MGSIYRYHTPYPVQQMKLPHISVFVILGLLAVYACKSPTESTSDPITISGYVIAQSDNSPIPNAIVRVINPPPEIVTVTGADGSFSFEMIVDSTFTVSLEVRKEGFLTKVTELLAIPERDIEVPSIKLSTTDDDDPFVPGVSGPPATIVLSALSHSTISVRETGENENATFVFEVRDAEGRPVDANNSTEVRFAFGGHPNGGEFLYPLTAQTNASGQAATTLTSGTVSGVVQVVAEFTRDDGQFIKSKPVNVAIHSGLPDDEHFAVGSVILNMPGNILNVQNSIVALVGDKYGNMVQPGTMVYFTTDGGIVEGSSPTNELGAASVTLVTAPPFPVHPQFGPGFATVRARTVNEFEQTIEVSTTVLFSLSPQISVTPTSIDVPNGGSQTFFFTVSDVHGNPLVAGTQISVEVEGDDLDVVGDTGITLPDTQFSGVGTTNFQFTLFDTNPDEEIVKPVQVTIKVTGGNGAATATLTGTTRL